MTIYPPTDAALLDTRLQSIRRTTTTFASIFSNIPFVKYDEFGNVIEQIKVPITYSNSEKYIKRLEGDPGEIDKKVQITLPRFEYGLIGYNYDISRKLNQANKITSCVPNATTYVNAPMPYNFNFELTLYTRNIEEANQILEYILPHFTPDYNIKITMVPELGISRNIPFTLNGENLDEDSTGSYDSQVRSVFRTLTFTAKSYIYPAPHYYKPILQAETYININSDSNLDQVSSGNGNFYIGETVYQGASFDRAIAIGTVQYWSNTSNTIQIATSRGTFAGNTYIKNIDGTKQYILNAANTNIPTYGTIITPTPNTYPPVGKWDYNINIIDNT